MFDGRTAPAKVAIEYSESDNRELRTSTRFFFGRQHSRNDKTRREVPNGFSFKQWRRTAELAARLRSAVAKIVDDDDDGNGR